MASRTGTLGTAPFRIQDTGIPQPAGYSNEQKGGHHCYPRLDDGSEESMYGIAEHHREWGMYCTVYNDTISTNNKTYRLDYNNVNTIITDNDNWVEVGEGGGGISYPDITDYGNLTSTPSIDLGTDLVKGKIYTAIYNSNITSFTLSNGVRGSQYELWIRTTNTILNGTLPLGTNKILRDFRNSIDLVNDGNYLHKFIITVEIDPDTPANNLYYIIPYYDPASSANIIPINSYNVNIGISSNGSTTPSSTPYRVSKSGTIDNIYVSEELTTTTIDYRINLSGTWTTVSLPLTSSISVSQGNQLYVRPTILSSYNSGTVTLQLTY